MIKKKLLLHTCCAPCVAHVSRVLSEDHEVTAYFYNPNIHPLDEYNRRMNELIHYSRKSELAIIVDEDDAKVWYKVIKGFEAEPEGSERCWKCYRMRLVKTVEFAKANNYDIFTTALSISPHKNADKINEIGQTLSETYGIEFLSANFKKNDGFKKSAELSKQYNLYRQTYCGCEFSMKNN